MRPIINIVLLVINVISIALSALFGIYGIYAEIMGSAKAGKLLKMFHIPLSYNQMLVAGIICIVVMIITHVIRMKLLGKPI